MKDEASHKCDIKSKQGAFCTICGEDMLVGAQCLCDIFSLEDRFCASCGIPLSRQKISRLIQEEEEKDVDKVEIESDAETDIEDFYIGDDLVLSSSSNEINLEAHAGNRLRIDEDKPFPVLKKKSK